MNIAIRVCNHFDAGIGHIMRMSHLAKSLLHYGSTIVFILDKPDLFCLELLSQYTIEYVYETDRPNAIEQRIDASLTHQFIEKHHINHLIVDSYQLHELFERQLRSEHLKITVFADQLLPHDCDILIDYKWQGINTNRRYKQLVPKECIRLLGPDFCLLDPNYAPYAKLPSRTNLNKKILFSLGGGGNLDLFIELFLAAKKQHSLSDITFLVVVGPKAENVAQLHDLSRNNPHIELISNTTSLLDSYLQCDLYVGTVGTALYELACLKMPAITFSISNNQQYNTNALEYFGHYLHFNHLKQIKMNELAELLSIAYNNIDRLRKLRKEAAIAIDALGAERIAQVLSGKAPLSPTRYTNHYDLSEELGKDYYFCAVTDKNINHYLQARNLECNRTRMLSVQKIPQVNHYKWWFQQKREQVLLVRKTGATIEPLMYLWHAVYKNKYIYSGWFVCKKNLDLNVIALGTQAHKNLVYRKYPHYIWLGVCQKTNKFVHLINRGIGFLNNPSPDLISVSKDLFSPIDENEYDFIYQVIPDQV